jgi:hypothetical protein
MVSFVHMFPPHPNPLPPGERELNDVACCRRTPSFDRLKTLSKVEGQMARYRVPKPN